jgi:hypothetical protein
LRVHADWRAFQIQNAGWPVYAAQDIDWPPEGVTHFLPRGLINALSNANPLPKNAGLDVSRMLLKDLYVYRNQYVYGYYRDFFSNELVEAYAKSWMRVGDEFGLRMAMAIKPDMPYAPFQLGYFYYSHGDYVMAAHYYAVTLRNFDAMEKLADDWKTLKPLKDSIHSDHNIARLHWNAVQQRLQMKTSKVQ